MFLSERHLGAPRLEAKHVRLVHMDLRGLLNDDDAVVVRNMSRERVQQRRLAGARAARDEDVVLGPDGVRELRRDHRCHGADGHEILQAVPSCEFPDGQRRSTDRAGWEHRGDTRPVLEACIEQRLDLRDLVAACTGDVLDRHGQVPRFQDAIGDERDQPVALDEHPRAARVHHHLGDLRIAQQILDRPEEGEDAIETAHNAPLATCSK